MKYTFFSALFSMVVLIGCSHIQDPKRVPASAEADQMLPCGLKGSVELK